jgi:hypothetical protein
MICTHTFNGDYSRKRGERCDLIWRRSHLNAIDGVLELGQHFAAHGFDGWSDRILSGA